MDVLTEPAAAAGIPAITLPVHMHSNGLPISMQFMGKYLGEQDILDVAYQLEQLVKFDRLSIMDRYK